MIGEPAPEFSVPGHDGKTYALKDFRGKNVVLVFYCMNDTPG
jgi:peroxiredoxin Q/BCP